MIPKYARERHWFVEKRLERIRVYSENFLYNRSDYQGNKKARSGS